ncbi:hypothetical protein T229_10985 [Tannerella sp. oral taxon BU063 isolate Cell 5]|uniref:RNA ligase domain-containing protein n=1 Tax=Tannerella sp. oral taxon BU063 isolate Cell 5 TaxID=1410950 RepID=W2CC77_9BACT|nr:hypothetical protein T229_10985 [Tannerella sp. oral taxon BU063 isolate Cell 5]
METKTEYQKINTLFKRDSNNVIMPDAWADPMFEYLANTKWEATEKVDGTNIRIIITPPATEGAPVGVEFRGRTDAAQIPEHLLKRLEELFPVDKMTEQLNPAVRPMKDTIVLYGEGYGEKIQSGGRYTKGGADFILFDVRVGDWWLLRDKVESIADVLGIKAVPLVGYMTIPEAVEFVRRGFTSMIAADPTLPAEGLVLKTPMGLLDRTGHRIVAKVKTVDFRKLEAKQTRMNKERKA